MPAPMTPEIAAFLASYGNPKLTLNTPAQMQRRYRLRAIMHNHMGLSESNTILRAWRFKLRNNAITRAAQYE